MDTVIGNGQPMVVGHDRHKDNCYGELIHAGQMHDASRHNDCSIRDHGHHNDDVQHRFGLRSLEEMASMRREISELKHDLSVKLLEDGQRTRELIRDQEVVRLRDDVSALRAQLIAASASAPV